MTMTSNLRTGAQILVDQLKIHGVTKAFCVPGESYLATLDALYDVKDTIEIVICRQEGGVTYMGDAYGKITGRPGICFVTRGPGATNASLGIHTAHQDSTPLILFIGQVGRAMMQREAFQEVDFRQMYAPLCKWVAQINDPARIPEMVARAFHVATSGRPGPVVLALPEDMQKEKTAANDARAYQTINPAPDSSSIHKLKYLLESASKPLMILGGSGWSYEGLSKMRQFYENWDLPVAAAFRRQDLIDNRNRNYAGDFGLGVNPALASRADSADLLLVVGAQMSEIITGGYELFALPCPHQTFIHVTAGLDEVARVYQPNLGINSGMDNFADAVASLTPDKKTAWADWTAEAHQDHLKNIETPEMSGEVDMGTIIRWLSQTLPDDAILTNGAGNFSNWVHRFYTYRHYPSQLAPQSGSMGYGVPSAVAAKIAFPERVVVSFSGDGDFLMCGQELATARQYDLPITFVVVNNGTYGTIRMHQERFYPGRVSGTDLRNPDFAALARAYGLHGELVQKTEDFSGAFDRCQKSGEPSLIEIQIDQNQISPRATISGLRSNSSN
jgi:acetolactate synthase-1/2/3 large subunit